MDVVNVTREAQDFTANAYFVPGEEPTLVDVGAMPGVEDVVAEYTDSLAKVVITHQHNDHVAKLADLLERFEATCHAFGDHPLRTHELADGDEIQIGSEGCEVVHTPGHADDHVSFVGARSLFSGDVVVYNDGAFEDGSFGRTDYPGMSRERLIESLQTLLERMPESVETIYAGHGDVYSGDIHAVVERALERAERREPKYPDE